VGVSGRRRRRIRVGVFAGGASAERQISLATGMQIAAHLPAERYEVVLLDPLALMTEHPALSPRQRALARSLAERSGRLEELPARDRRALPEALQRQIEEASASLVPATRAMVAQGAGERIDVAFVAIHGPWGEDGTIQGLLELLGIPYVGSGVLASALAMDKAMARLVLAASGVEVPRGFVVSAADEPGGSLAARAATELRYPVVVKPVSQGSSFGITIVEGQEGLGAALAEALRYDERALVEERVEGTELTVGVVGREPDPAALPVIEIVPKRSFFDYRAKYDPELSDEICPARIPDELARRAQELALAAHRALGCRDLSRTDMIAAPDGRMPVLEVNTIPGMTANSLVPKAARAAGIGFAELCERLVELALERAR
jgi:D-alanine-D-alanine ligase